MDPCMKPVFLTRIRTFALQITHSHIRTYMTVGVHTVVHTRYGCSMSSIDVVMLDYLGRNISRECVCSHCKCEHTVTFDPHAPHAHANVGISSFQYTYINTNVR